MHQAVARAEALAKDATEARTMATRLEEQLRSAAAAAEVEKAQVR
jgi:hypothetical protein